MFKRSGDILFMAVAVCLYTAACSLIMNTTEKTVFVGPQMVDCQGAGPQKCLLVKQNPEDEYTLFYDQIVKFDYQDGFEYELRVEEEQVENPPADGSSVRWTLVEVVSKNPVAEVETVPGLEDISWRLVSYLDPKGNQVKVSPGSEITAEFLDGKIEGSAGCNQYSGSYQFDGDRLKIGDIAFTERYCFEPLGVMEQEAAYLEALGFVESYEIDGQNLMMTNAEGAWLLTFNAIQGNAIAQPAISLKGYLYQDALVHTFLGR